MTETCYVHMYCAFGTRLEYLCKFGRAAVAPYPFVDVLTGTSQVSGSTWLLVSEGLPDAGSQLPCRSNKYGTRQRGHNNHFAAVGIIYISQPLLSSNFLMDNIHINRVLHINFLSRIYLLSL